MFSESFTLEFTSIHDETSKDTAIVFPSPVSTRVRFANRVPGRASVDMCPADPHVGNTQADFSLPVTSQSVSMNVGNKQVDSSLPVIDKFVSMGVNEDCPGHERSSTQIIIVNMNDTPMPYRVVRDRSLHLLSRLIAFTYVDAVEALRYPVLL